MGMLMEYNDVFDYCNYVDQEYWFDLIDIESNDDYIFIFRVFEYIVLCSFKWMYGVFFVSEVVLE